MDPAAQALLNSNQLRDCLREVYARHRREHRHFSYAALARRAGFASRSYPRDILAGDKRITASTLEKFLKVFQLSEDEANILRTLLALNSSTSHSATSMHRKLTKLRSRLASRSQGAEPERMTSVLDSPLWPTLIAALADTPQGCDLATIADRTGLSESQCATELEAMLVKNLVQRESPRHYRPTVSHLLLRGLGQNQTFANFFLNSLESTRRALPRGLSSDEDLFLASTISIDRARMKDFKAQLRALLEDFVETVEDPGGGEIVQLTCAFHRTPKSTK
ncbi:MAG: TIGR02147 family protein [Bdellovibrionales bacterium]|nr:TIGR02147 family protein [Bdellovibrionales bacterium]